MRQILCSKLVGREEEMDFLRAAIDAAREGKGGTIVLSGEAGIGKSRLVREVETFALKDGLRVLRGRAVEGSTEAYRPLAEALLAAMREGSQVLDAVPELDAFRPILGRLIPEWRRHDVAIDDNSVVLMGEAILRILHVLGADRGCLLILEDLHWADADTLAIFEYLADNLFAERVLLLSTSRGDEASDALGYIRAMSARRVCQSLELTRLDEERMHAMASVCLDVNPCPEGLLEMLCSSAEGVPFLIEELLAAWVESGALIPQDDAWEVAERLAPITPVTFAGTVRRRLGTVGGEARAVLEAAAVLGRHFDWTLLPEATELDARDVLAGLHRAVDAQLVTVESRSGQPSRYDAAKNLNDQQGTFRFRHALTRDAVLGQMLPPEQEALATLLLSQLERTHPGLPLHWCDLAARLAESAGNITQAMELFLESGRRALARGALAGAERTLEHALSLQPSNGALVIDIEDALAEVLALAGRWEEVRVVGDHLLARLRADPTASSRIAAVHLHLARAALAAGRHIDSTFHLEQARRTTKPENEAGLLPSLDALAAHVAIEQGRLDEAAAFARSALEGAERTAQSEVACEALEALGRCARVTDLDQAEAAFDRALSIAEENDLTVWRLRALHELGTLDIFRDATVDRLAAARQLAVDVGALATAAMIDVQIAAYYGQRVELQATLEAAQRSESLARRLHLDLVAALALAFQGSAYAMSGNQAAMEDAIAESFKLAGDQPDIIACAWESRAFVAAVQEDWLGALHHAEKAMAAYEGKPPTAPAPLYSLWALLRTIQDIDGEASRELVRQSGATVNPINRGFLGYADAIALGRAGRSVEATSAVTQADVDLAGLDWSRRLGRRLVAEAALADGWGDPTAWLWDAYSYFEKRGLVKLTSACRTLLVRTGVPMTLTSRHHSEVPSDLRRWGITRREQEVLDLVAEGLSNKQMGERLYLSPRTVEKHVASLLAKTETRSRTALASWSASRPPRVG